MSFFEIAVHTTSKLNFFMENHVPSAFHRCYKTCVDTANLQEVMDNYGDWLGLKFRLMLFNDEKRLWRFVEYWLPPCTNTFPSIMDIIIDDLKVYSLVGYENTEDWNLDDLLLEEFIKVKGKYKSCE